VRPSDAGKHLAAYEAAMWPYVRQVQRLPPSGANGVILASRAAIALRTHVIRTMARCPLRNLLGAQAGKLDTVGCTRHARHQERWV
jgi:hypothetical protein